ncbi:MAG: hypothetical protein L3J47_03665 [Sulfurovum sp.]|nr:hypothetical protein [Sulfurovum sp.]
MLKQQECYRKFIRLLGRHLQNAIAFVYVKNQTLFVAVKHPGFKMELHYNRDLLKSVLTQLVTHEHTCAMLRADKVVIFHSRYHPVNEPKEETVPHYEELAKSEFDICTEDEALKAQFEKIKESIQCNRS